MLSNEQRAARAAGPGSEKPGCAFPLTRQSLTGAGPAPSPTEAFSGAPIKGASEGERKGVFDVLTITPSARLAHPGVRGRRKQLNITMSRCKRTT